MGQEHEFMNNCLSCGRIHCFQEGPGPCLYCGTEVNHIQTIINHTIIYILGRSMLGEKFKVLHTLNH